MQSPSYWGHVREEETLECEGREKKKEKERKETLQNSEVRVCVENVHFRGNKLLVLHVILEIQC